ncbi:MAG: hypothetical protein RLZZ347_86 [Candidatus Parcubacteria bacterium]|jgi:hypothetical protein
MKSKTFFEVFQHYFLAFVYAGETDLARKIFRRLRRRIQAHRGMYDPSVWDLSESRFFDELAMSSVLKNSPEPVQRESVYVPYGGGWCDGSPCNDA